MRIAVIGAGVSGLGAALRLQPRHQVVVFEKAPRAGGHTHTVDVELGGLCFPVDTGFLVFNERTYPLLIALFRELGIESAPSDMSFSVSVGPHRLEWCGSNLRSVFAQPTNTLRPGFWRMLRDMLRFNREATALACVKAERSDAPLDEPLGRFLIRSGYSAEFRDHYLLPMAAAIWSCPTETMLDFPLGSFVRFFHNHGLLQIENRPRWMTVPGGARRYVDRILSQLEDVRLGVDVEAVVRRPGGGPAGIGVCVAGQTEWFDHVVLACHSDQALALLAEPDADEHAILGAIGYQPNRAWLHTDEQLMPLRRRAWAAWNYLSDGRPGSARVAVTYWLNRLQPLPTRSPVFVSLNPFREPAAERVIEVIDYAHPVFDLAAWRAQLRLADIQGRHGLWFAGAWTGYGFHEDGLRSGLHVARAIDALSPALAVAA